MKTECAAVRTLLSWFPPVVTPRGDGSFIVQPPKPVAEVTVLEAARMMHVHKSSIYRRIWEKGLACSRPLERKILIPIEALEKWRAESVGPEFKGKN